MDGERDYLDEIIEKTCAESPEFALKWAEAEAGLRFSAMRKEAGLTQAQVAETMGLPQPRVAEIERNPSRVSFGRILRYVSAVGGSVELTGKVIGHPERS